MSTSNPPLSCRSFGPPRQSLTKRSIRSRSSVTVESPLAAGALTHHTAVRVLHIRRYGRRQPGWIYTSAEIPALPAGCPGWLSEVVLGLLRSDHCDEERRLTPAEGVAMLEVRRGALYLASDLFAALVLYLDPALNLRLSAERR